MFGVLHSILLLGVGCLPAPGLRSLRCYLQYLSSSHSISQSFVSHGTWSSNSPPKCPSECLPRITHVPENGFSLRASCCHPVLWRLHAWPRALPDLCPTLGSAAGMRGTWCHDISGRKSHLWVWSLLERIPHCVIPKPWCRLFGSTERRSAWWEQPRELTFYKCHSWLVSTAKCLRQKTSDIKDI